MTIEKIAVFDVLGPMYHYDARGWIDGAIEPLIERLHQHGYTGKNMAEEARDEEDLQRTQKEPILIMPGFAETVLYLRHHQVLPVVVSAGTPWVLENTLKLAARDYQTRTGDDCRAEQLVASSDLISTIPFGSKRDPETWRKAVQQYVGAEVIAIYEDTFANLTAAAEGLTPQVGYHVTSTRHGLARLCRDQRIYRGHMLEALEHLQREVISK